MRNHFKKKFLYFFPSWPYPESSCSHCLGTVVTVQAPNNLRENSGCGTGKRALCYLKNAGRLFFFLFSLSALLQKQAQTDLMAAQRENLVETCFLAKRPGKWSPGHGWIKKDPCSLKVLRMYQRGKEMKNLNPYYCM